MMMRMPAAALPAVRGLILVGVAVARARGRCVALVVEHDVVRGWGALDAASFAFQLQVEPAGTVLMSAADFVR